MIRIFFLFLITTTIFASSVKRFHWEDGQSYLVFLEKISLPIRPLYYNLDKDDQRLTEEMHAGIPYQILQNDKGSIEQILLPLNDELQIHIYQKDGTYKFEAIPIISTIKKEVLTTKVINSPNYTIIKKTGSRKLAQVFTASFRNSLNFKHDIRKGDKLLLIYNQKYRLGRPFSMPKLQVAMIEMHHKKHSIYLNSDGRYYNGKGHQVKGFLFACPVRKVRISSYFTKRRWHPILHKWKAHLGVDYAARRGTPIMAAGDGIVIWSARMGSYGNLVKIRHADGYETRYAHMKAFRHGIHKGVHVKKGQVIGYIGTTGRSTGPHLHFEVRIHGRAINPLHIVQVATKKLQGKKYKAFIKLKKGYDNTLNRYLKLPIPYIKKPPFQNLSYLHTLKPMKTQ